MSDYNPLLDEGANSPLEGSPDDVGETAGDGQSADQPAYEEPRNYLDPNQYEDHYVRVKVDGQELEVPLTEALQGYSRTADYTRKTQDLARMRQGTEYALAVQRALQAQPAATLRLLAEQYGVQPEPQSPPPEPWEQPSAWDDGDSDVYSDPIERRLAQQQQVIDQLAQRDEYRMANEELRAAIGGLQTKYQLSESDVREVIGQALQSGVGPASFEMIYKNIAFDRAQQARQAMQAERQAAEQQREAAKNRGQQLIGQGVSANGAGAPNPAASPGRMSIQEAFEAAERQHGRRF